MSKLFKPSTLLFFLFLFFVSFYISSCCTSSVSPHKLKGSSLMSGEYTVDHTLIGDCTEKNHHLYIAEIDLSYAQGIENGLKQELLGLGHDTTNLEKLRPVTNSYNSHGLTLDEGNSNIMDEPVIDILRHKKYKDTENCAQSNPIDGDIIVYLDKELKVIHSGIIVQVISESNIIVQSKWGNGPEYKHQIKAIPLDWFKIVYYRQGC